MSKSESKGSTKPKRGTDGSQNGKGEEQDASTLQSQPISAPSPGSSSFVVTLGALVALLSLLLGILTPPFLKKYQENLGGALSSPSAILNSGSARKLDSIPNSNGSKVEFPCTQETLDSFLHDVAIPGLHIVCLDESNGLRFYKDALPASPVPTVPMEGILQWAELRKTLVQNLGLPAAVELYQPWATYSPTGQRLLAEDDSDSASIEDLKSLGMILVFQGGQWMWPGVRKGFRRQVEIWDNEEAASKSVVLETLSLFPLVLSVDYFLSPDECDAIKVSASPTMEYSQVTLMDKDQGRPASDFRTSQTTFLNSNRHSFLKPIERRTASLVRVPVSHQEHVQVLRYGHMEKYDTHHDYFDPSLYKQDPGTLRLIQNGKRNRFITVFWYLSDVKEGGETVFPREGKAPWVPNEIACERGLRVQPREGRVIIFYSQTQNGEVDPYSLHGACPVIDGVKHAANKWVWSLPVNYVQA